MAKIPALSIRSISSQGFRRGGRAFTKTATVIPLNTLNNQQITTLKNEPQLTCKEIAIDEGDAGIANTKPTRKGAKPSAKDGADPSRTKKAEK